MWENYFTWRLCLLVSRWSTAFDTSSSNRNQPCVSAREHFSPWSRVSSVILRYIASLGTETYRIYPIYKAQCYSTTLTEQMCLIYQSSTVVIDMTMSVITECHKENEIKARDPIRCRECGYRIMYKKRTKRSILSPIEQLKISLPARLYHKMVERDVFDTVNSALVGYA